MGRWHYDANEGTPSEAAEWFERSLELDPAYPLSLLYRAHCLHDLAEAKTRRGEAADWCAAVRAYQAVPLEDFQGQRAHIIEVVQEALAFCQMRAGDRDAAVEGFSRLIDRLKRSPHLEFGLLLHYMKQACRGPLREELGERFEELAETYQIS